MFKRISIYSSAIAIVLAIGSAGSALGDAHGNASCLGFEASGVAPAGSSDEFPGGMKELIQFVHVNLGQAGPVIREAAHQHLLSHEACDAGE
jgi:hypothetical protein